MSQNMNRYERVKSRTMQAAAILGAASLAYLGVSAYESAGGLFGKLNLGKVFQETPAHGQSAINKKTYSEKVLDVQCSDIVTVDAGVKTSSSVKFLGLTIMGASYNKQVPISEAVCGKGIKTIATTESINGRAKKISVNLANFMPMMVGVNDLSYMACLPLKSNASSGQILKEQRKYDALLKKHKIPSCSDGLSSEGLFGTNSQANNVEELGRRLAVIAGYVTPLSAREYGITLHDAEEQVSSEIGLFDPNIPVSFQTKRPTITGQIAAGISQIKPELNTDFEREWFTRTSSGLALCVKAPYASGEVLIPDKVSLDELHYLNKQLSN